MGHFSPRSVAAAMSWTVTRRVLLPPYSAFPAPAEGPVAAGGPAAGGEADVAA